jgi:hypothetical protein
MLFRPSFTLTGEASVQTDRNQLEWQNRRVISNEPLEGRYGY